MAVITGLSHYAREVDEAFTPFPFAPLRPEGMPTSADNLSFSAPGSNEGRTKVERNGSVYLYSRQSGYYTLGFV